MKSSHFSRGSSWLAIVSVIVTFVQINATEVSQEVTKKNEKIQGADNLKPASLENGLDEVNGSDAKDLEARKVAQGEFVKDIISRLHSLDSDIGKLAYNSTSMYAPNEIQENQKGGERFSEVLNDLDALQDEVGVLIANATRTRQYNMLVRLRPLNTILYRIRHNLHLMRNSLVAINTVSSLEKIGNSVLDSTLQVFMRPDANLSEELGDTGNYDINLDNESTTTSTATTTTTTTTTTSTQAPSSTTTTATSTNSSTTPNLSPAPSLPIGTAVSQSSSLRRNATRTSTTTSPALLPLMSTTSSTRISGERAQLVVNSGNSSTTTLPPRTNQRSGTRRAAQRGSQRRVQRTTTTSTTKAPELLT